MNKLKFIGVTLSAMLITMSSFAQKSDNSEDYLPKAGHYSIGISANPLINFVGNMFNGTIDQKIGDIGGSTLAPITNNAAFNTKHYFPTVSIMGKYMLTDNIAARVNLGFMINRVNDATYSLDDNASLLDPLSRQKVENTMKQTSNGGSLSAGLEYRIGRKRVQGVFSGSLMYAYSSSSQKFSYGNGITEENQQPTINSEPEWTNDYIALPGMPSARATKHSAVGYHSIGLVAGAGIEWFLAPLISLGAEVNLALIYSLNPSTYSEYEGYNINSQEVENYTDLTAPSSSEFVFGTGNVGGDLSINFYF